MTTFAAPTSDTAAVALNRPWALHWRGRVFRESALTGAHLGTLAMLSGHDSFAALNLTEMSPTEGYVRLSLMLSAFLTVEAGAGGADAVAGALAEVRTAPAEEILAALRFD